jgi:hypothetical protein
MIPISFHLGAIGVAYAAFHVGRLFVDYTLQHQAADLISWVASQRQNQTALDVIGGAAGAIPVLLDLADHGVPHARMLAATAADLLVARAHRLPAGWAWGAAEGASRPLAGYSHGACGPGVSLLEMAAVTGTALYVHAGIQALAYEMSAFDENLQNWLDFRDVEVGALLHSEDHTSLRARGRLGAHSKTTANKAMLAWCHGAPGIGLARLRAHALLGRGQDLREAQVAVATTAAAVARREPRNFSLCHGLAGNAETLLCASAAWNDARLHTSAVDCLLEGGERYERAGLAWPSGVLYGWQNPSLMLGDAGIGYACLRAADAGVPSILLVTPSPSERAPIEVAEAAIHAMEDVQTYYRTSLQRAERLGRTIDLASVLSNTEGLSPVLAVRGALVEASIGCPLLADATRADHAGVALLSTDLDLLTDVFEGIARNGAVDDHAAWTLSSRARLVAEEIDWEHWDSADKSETHFNVADQGALLLFRDGTTVSRRPVRGATFALLSFLTGIRSIAEIRMHIADLVVGVDSVLLTAWIRDQLGAAQASGYVVQVRPVDAEPVAKIGPQERQET